MIEHFSGEIVSQMRTKRKNQLILKSKMMILVASLIFFKMLPSQIVSQLLVPSPKLAKILKKISFLTKLFSKKIEKKIVLACYLKFITKIMILS